MAQVYSVNMVGYINKQIPQGYSMIANQLNSSPDNRVSTLFPAPPNNTAIYRFNGAGYDSITYAEGLGWDDGSGTFNATMALNPGEGVFIFAPSAFTQTFVGEVALTSTVNVRPGFQVISSALPQSLPIAGAPPAGLGFPIAAGDTVYQFNGAGYDTSEALDDGAGGVFWNPAPPVPDIGESFFFSGAQAAGNRSWTRNFSVGP